MKTLNEILEIITKSGYIKTQLAENVVKYVCTLPLGTNLIENLRQEWYKNKGTINTYRVPSNEIKRICQKDTQTNILNIFKNQNILYNLQHVKQNFQNEVPLAIKEEIHFENNSLDADVSRCFDISIDRGTFLSCIYFFNNSLAAEHFFKIQRERKIWWMKLSSNPGRYSLTDFKIDEYNNFKIQQVKISSKFNFGHLDVENVEMLPLESLKLESQSGFALKDIKLNKQIIPTAIKTVICLETAALALLFDAIEETKNDKISIQRKIAPFQCSILCLADDEKMLADLEDLAKYLTSLIRSSGITVLNLQKCSTNNANRLHEELVQMDKIGVPYSIILEMITLQNGLMKLRNRDTTISETIHITDVPQYLIKIFHS